MIGELGGRERWSDILRTRKVEISFITVVAADWAETLERLEASEAVRNLLNERKAFVAAPHVGDLLMIVRLELTVGDDTLLFQLRQTSAGKWQVIGEATDY